MRKERKPLIIRGEEIRTLEKLNEVYDFETFLELIRNGSLQNWLRDRYYEEELEMISALVLSSTALVYCP